MLLRGVPRARLERLRPGPRATFLAVAALSAGLLACFEAPVDNRLVLNFQEDGEVEIRVEVSVPLLAGEGDEGPLRRRVKELREALLGGWDEWSPRFARVTAASESVAWEKEEGVLVRYARAARIADPDDLGRFFVDTGLSVFYSVEPERATLEIYPGGSSRATRKQRQKLARALDDWIESLQAYYAAGEELYRYLDGRPGRARACLGHLMADVAHGESGPLSAEEEALVAPLQEAMEAAWSVLLVEPGEEYSLSELSHLVYDPFPADLLAITPETATEVEGFTQEEEALMVRRVGLWESLAALEGRFLQPDLLLVYVRHARDEDAELDLDELAAAPRRAEAVVRRDELEGAIVERLTPPAAYRASWSLAP